MKQRGAAEKEAPKKEVKKLSAEEEQKLKEEQEAEKEAERVKREQEERERQEREAKEAIERAEREHLRKIVVCQSVVRYCFVEDTNSHKTMTQPYTTTLQANTIRKTLQANDHKSLP